MTVFIDARTLGRRLCCRILSGKASNVWELLNAVGVVLPAGVQPEWVTWLEVFHALFYAYPFRGPEVSPGADFTGYPDDGGDSA